MTTTKETGKTRSKQLLFETNLAVEDLIDSAANMLSVWKSDNERDKKKIGVGLRELMHVLQHINNNLKESFSLTQDKTLAKNKISEWRADTNVQLKRESILNPSFKGVTSSHYRIQQITTNKRSTAPPTSQRPLKKRNCNLPDPSCAFETFLLTNKPKHSSMYSVCEIVHYMLVNESSPLYEKSINKTYNFLLSNKVICFSLATLKKHHKLYKDTGILPSNGHDATRRGRPPKIEKENVTKLNDRVIENPGLVAGSSELTLDILDLSRQQRQVRGVDTSFDSTTVSSGSKKRYNHEASLDPKVSLVPKSSAKVQGSRRQTASTSHRNVMSQIATLVNANFVKGEWTDKPTNLPEGAKLAHKLIEDATGCSMRPIPTCQIFNYDFTSHYYLKLKPGLTRSDLHDNYVRVSSKAIESGSRKTKCPFFDGEEESCSGVNMKWMDCTNASGDVLPIVIVIKLSSDEMPQSTASILYIQIPGLSINSFKDVRSCDHPGWVVFVKPGASMSEFHQWYEELIIAPSYKMILEKRQHMPIAPYFPEYLCARVFSDSDMTNVKHATTAVNMAQSRKLGLHYIKVGAKTTSFTQPLDVGPSFKAKKAAAKVSEMNFTQSDNNLRLVVEQCFTMAAAKGELALKPRRREAIINLLADAPEIQERAFGGGKVVKAYIAAGFIDSVTKSCPDIHQVMMASNVNWESNKKMTKADFLAAAEECVGEMFRTGQIDESTYDRLDFPIDTDCSGTEYPLTSSRVDMARSMPMYTPDILRRKQEDLLAEFHKNRELWFNSQKAARNIISSAQRTLDEMLKIADGRRLACLSYADLNVFKLEQLSDFVKVRKVQNPLSPLKIPGAKNKGKPIDASQGKPCLLLLAKQFIEDDVIATEPDIPEPVMPIAISPNFEVRNYFRAMEVEDFIPSEQWIADASRVVLPIATNAQVQKWTNDLDGLRRESQLLAKKVLNRLPCISSD